MLSTKLSKTKSMLSTQLSKTKPVFICPTLKQHNTNRIIKTKTFEPAKENSNSSSEPANEKPK